MKVIFQINSIRHEWRERKGFRLLREKGTEDYVFIHFISAADIVIDGRAIHAEPHSCIIYPPYSYHEFYTEDKELNHDWIHFLPPDDSSLDRFGLSVNTLYSPKDTGFITPMISTMELEFLNRPMLWELHTDGLMICLFSLLGREVILKDSKLSIYREDKEKFDSLRLELRNNPSAKWCVEDMAASLSLSRSRFSVLYRLFYDISPIDDLIDSRIERAKYLLSISNMSVNAVSEELGYGAMEHFIRQFKAKVGMSPTAYRDQRRR